MQPVRLFCPAEGAADSRLVTTSDLFAEYLARTESQQSARTFAERRKLLELFDAENGPLALADLIADDLERWLETHPGWRSDWTRMRIVGTLKRPFNWAVRKGLIDRNPFASVSAPPGQRGKPLRPEHFRAFLRSFDAEMRRVLLFMSWTGCRPCELASLEWSFIDCEAGAATLWTHKTARTRKDRAPRVIYLPAVAVRLLIWIRRGQPIGETRVFLNSQGRPWKRGALDLRFYRKRRKLGLPADAKLYGVRHGWATQLALAGVELKTLATLLGHSSARMAEHYIHLAGQTVHLRGVLEKGLAARGAN